MSVERAEQINKSGTAYFVEILDDNEIEQASTIDCRVLFCWNNTTGKLTCVARERNNQQFSPTSKKLTRAEALAWAKGMAQAYD